MTEALDLLIARPGTEADYGYVIKTWGEGYREAFDSALKSESAIARRWRTRYYTSQANIARGWLAVAGTIVHVLALRNETRMVIAFAVVTEIDPGYSMLHWLYVQKDWERKGLGMHLLTLCHKPKMAYTHMVSTLPQSIADIVQDWAYESPIPKKDPQ